MNRKNKNEPLFRECFVRGIAVREQGEEENGRVLELSFSSEEPYMRWFGNEILCHDKDAVNLTRLEEIGIVLFNHDTDRPIGHVLSVELDETEHRCRAVVELDEDEESEKILAKVKSGTLKGVSVGYMVEEYEEVKEGERSSNERFEGPCVVATKWAPFEVSIVSVPADATVGVGRSIENNSEQEEGDVKMEDNKIKEAEVKTPEVNAEQERAAGQTAERARVMEINQMCRTFDVDGTEYIEKGMSVEETRAAVMEKLAVQRQAVQVTVQADEADKFRAAAADGLAMRAGVRVAKPAPGAEDFRGKRMLRLAAECIEREKNTSTRNMTDEMLVREALTGTGAFPGILSNVANKSMAQAYQEAPTTFQLWTGRGSNSDFKAATRYRLSEADSLELIRENGEFKAGEMTEASVTASVATYGKTFSLTRQAIINDDLGALNQMPAKYGAAAKRMIDNMVYKVLTDNPTIEGAALFHNSHKNLGSGALSVASLGAAKAAMAKQKNIGGKESLNIQPAFLIVPVDLEVVAAQLINSVVDPSKNNAAVNPFANKLTVVSTPILSDSSQAVWYLASAPGFCPTVEVTYLNGVDSPTIESAVQFDTLGIKYRIYQDVGVNLLDFRGLYKSSGV